MPHLVILYTGQLDAEADMGVLCRRLADTMTTIEDEKTTRVFPIGGIRVLAYPAAHYAVADGGVAGAAAGLPQGASAPESSDTGQRADPADYGFVYLNLRMSSGRSEQVRQKAGELLVATAKDFFAPLFARRRIGVTLQIDEGHEVFNAKHSNLHPLFDHQG